MTHRIATIIHYCTNDYRFLGKIVEEAKKFSSLIIVPVCDHFFDGVPENRALLDQTYAAFPDVQFLEFAWDVNPLYTPFHQMPEGEQERVCLWHSFSRYAACHFLPEHMEYVLFLDADEIPEGARFADFLDKGEYRQYNALWFLSHRYRFSASEQLIEEQYAPLMVRVESLEPNLVLNERERFGHLISIPGAHWLKGKEGAPFFHHYSWVRSRQECLQKVGTWAKRAQANWIEKLENAWQKGEFLEDLAYRVVTPYFDPLAVEIPHLKASSFTNIRRIDAKELFRIQLEKMLD